MAYFA